MTETSVWWFKREPHGEGESEVAIADLPHGVYVCNAPSGQTALRFVTGPVVIGGDEWVYDINLTRDDEDTDDGPGDRALLVVGPDGHVFLGPDHYLVPDSGPSFGDTLVVEEKQKRIGELLAKAGGTTDAWQELVSVREAIPLLLSLFNVRWDPVAQAIVPAPESKYQRIEEWT